MWLRTEDRQLVNMDNVLYFALEETRIVAYFAPLPRGDGQTDVFSTIGRYSSREDAAAAFERLVAGLDDSADIADFS